MAIYTLHHQVRRLDEALCGNVRKYSTGDILFSGQGNEPFWVNPLQKAAKVPSSLPMLHRNHYSLQRSTIRTNEHIGVSRSYD